MHQSIETTAPRTPGHSREFNDLPTVKSSLISLLKAPYSRNTRTPDRTNTANLEKSRDLVFVVTLAVCDSRFQLQDTVLAVSDLRQRVIARDQSDRSPVWPYQSRCICLLFIENNFKHQIYVLGQAVIAIIIFNIHVSSGIIMSCICQGFQNTLYVLAYKLQMNQAG